jgi:hypothetical protein
MTFQVGDRVKITQRRHGGESQLWGRGVIATVGARKTTLVDGTEWRTSDGFECGSKPTRGIGCGHQRRIEVVG